MDLAYYHQMAALEDRHWWFAARRQIVEAVLDRCPFGPEAEVLEVGCGTGGNLSLLASYGKLYACEPEAEAQEMAAARGIAPVEPGLLPDGLPFEQQSFDLIALLDVLEHVDDDEASLRTLYTRLKPRGFLLLTVPAYPFLWSQHDVVNHHFRRYVRGDLVAKVRAAGYSLQHATYFNTTLFPIVAGIRFLGRWSRQEGAI